MGRFFPNFKLTYLIVGLVFIILPMGLFMKGLMPSMAEFQVPKSTLDSPHYYDAILWVYVHMVVIGLLILLIGYSVENIGKQKLITIFLFLITIFYTYLDFRSSDSNLGNALYKGESSIVPAFISLFVNFLFLQLLVKMFRNSK